MNDLLTADAPDNSITTNQNQNIVPDGILLIDKICGITSFDVIRKIKAAFKKSGLNNELKKIGHAGTLDPIASGLLITLINGATKRSEDFLTLDKTYEAELFIGCSTDSYDATGICEHKIELDADYYKKQENINKLQAALCSFRGEIFQEPPMYSAIKKNGQPLYKLARKNITIEREKRKCTIYSLEYDGQKPLYDDNLKGFKLKYTISCSKGTYIRSLCHDIGVFIGIPCHMSALRRTQTGIYKVTDALPFDKIETGGVECIIKNIYRLREIKS